MAPRRYAVAAASRKVAGETGFMGIGAYGDLSRPLRLASTGVDDGVGRLRVDVGERPGRYRHFVGSARPDEPQLRGRQDHSESH